jgi:hypothetical protein
MKHARFTVVHELCLNGQTIVLMNSLWAANQNQAVWWARRDLHRTFEGRVPKNRFVLQCITDATGQPVQPTVN